MLGGNEFFRGGAWILFGRDRFWVLVNCLLLNLW